MPKNRTLTKDQRDMVASLVRALHAAQSNIAPSGNPYLVHRDALQNAATLLDVGVYDCDPDCNGERKNAR